MQGKEYRTYILNNVAMQLKYLMEIAFSSTILTCDSAA